ncbi:MAG: DUF3427 domain-containing protein [Methanosphaera stadtmanae]|nr:DUF3427 domain-containing protein [Methanosphaera stadtmanae]
MYENKLVLNSPQKDLLVLNVIKKELEKCDEFFMSVAFITGSGITPLLQILKDIKSKGKILTTDYNYFTQPDAIKSLISLDNIEVRIFKSDNVAFHTKGYLFNKDGKFNILVGSSNLTANALMKNKEWNIYSTYDKNDQFTTDLLESFNEYWNESVKAEDYITEYTKLYRDNKPKYTVQNKNHIEVFTPNAMQNEFIQNFVKLVNSGEKRGLLISATGTGKTYASAFALKEVKAEKVLFIVHREQIAKQALNTFKKVFEEDNFGLLSGNSKDTKARYLFSTIQMMSKEKIYTSFRKDEFDYIVIDEVHRAGAPSYQKIMDYFTPKFYLGMSASPDRTDDFDIYELFDHNIIYEIRLQKALEENMLCDFHYFGISDPVDANDISDQHVDKIIENLEYYNYCGERVKGLIFCNNIENSVKLSEKFNKKGYKTLSLSGSNSQEEREEAIMRLTSDEESVDKLDYLFSVDIFNEGVDIKELNQIVMLRPTESSIIFIQQLGRGLRKSYDKEYVVILDFISNYDNNYLIPVALSGDRTYNKDTMRRFIISTDTTVIGNSTINFDKIAKEKIYKSINDASLEKLSFIREKYRNLKYKLGKTPTLIDFYQYDELDPMFILSYAKGKKSTYPELLVKLDKTVQVNLSKEELLYLKFISTKIANGKRPHELNIIKELIKYGNYCYNDEISSVHALNVLNKKFYKRKDQEEYEKINFYEQKDKTISIDRKFKKLLEHKEFKDNINDLITLGLTLYEDKYSHEYSKDPFKLYEKYSREDAVRLLNFKSNDSSTIYGYRTKDDITNKLHCPIFVTYHKKETISKSTQYEDKFINKKEFNWMTRSNLKIESKEVQQIIKYKENENKFYLFINKSDDEGKEFYYMGQVTPIDYKQTTIPDDNGQENPIVKMKLKLKEEVKQEIYDYIIN